MMTACILKHIFHFQIGAIIIAPTRGLASQIYEVLLKFLDNITQFSHMLVIGGENPTENVMNFLQNGYV